MAAAAISDAARGLPPGPHGGADPTSRLPDAPIEWALQELTSLAAVLSAAPIAAIGLMEADRPWFPFHVGLDAWQVPLVEPFLSEALRHADVSLIYDATARGAF